MAKLKLRKPNLKTGKPNFKVKKPTKAGLKSAVVSTKFLTIALVILGLGGFGYSGYYWYSNIFIDTDRIFYDMVDKSLNTQSVMRSIEQKAEGRTENQSILVSFSPTISLHSRSTLEQITQSREQSAVSTETIGTKESDYIRYTNIVIPKDEGGKTDYSTVVNTWAKRSNETEGQKQSQFLDEAVFTFIPFGNFPEDKRAELIKIFKEKNVYKITGDKIEWTNGRPILRATVSIQPRGLVEVMREYAKSTGVGNLEQLDPTQYDDKNSFSIQVKVDVISRHLKQITYPTGDRIENYDSYGINRAITPPQNPISIDELQSRLQQN
jgi:hypothetical protein